MKKILNTLLFMILGFSSFAYADIVKTGGIKTIEKIFNQASSGTIVIFDVADVLLTSKDQILNVHNKKYKKELKANLEKSLDKKEAQVLLSIISTERKNGPVAPGMPSLISGLQKNNVKALGLTSCYTGKMGNIESLEDWRINELLRSGYNFEKSWEGISPRTFYNLESSNKEALPPVFKKGIIFASRVPKGKVLEAFFNNIKIKPKKIIFLDNKLKNIMSVEDYAKDNNIDFIGIEYTAVIDAKAKPLNKKRAEFQFETLKNERKWLSDAEADEIMSQKKK